MSRVPVWTPNFEYAETKMSEIKNLRRIKPFSMAVVGSSETGKSYWFECLYKRYLADCYDIIVLICETDQFTNAYDYLPTHKLIKHDTWSDDIVLSLKKRQARLARTGKEQWDILLIIDDVFDSKMKFSEENKKLWTLVRNCRITPIRISQKMNWLSTECRSGAKILVVFSCVGPELEIFERECIKGLIERSDLRSVERSIWGTPYQPMIRDIRIINGQHRPHVISRFKAQPL